MNRDARDLLVQVEHRPLARRPQEEVGRRGCRGVIWSRIFSRTAVALCVVKTLAVTMSRSRTPAPRRLQGLEQVLGTLQGGVVRLPVEVVPEALGTPRSPRPAAVRVAHAAVTIRA